MPDDDDHESDLDFWDRCVDACVRRWDQAIETFGSTKVRLVLLGMLLLLIFISLRILTDVFDVNLVALVVVPIAVGILCVGVTLLPARATATTSPDDPTETTNTTAPTGVPGSLAGTTSGIPMSSRTWLRSWPWQTFLRGDRIEVGGALRPPVFIPLRRVARITLSTDQGEVLTLMDGSGATIGQVSQNGFSVEFLAALAEVTGKEIEYLPFSGRPAPGGA